MKQNKVSLCVRIKYNKGCFWALEVIKKIVLEFYINAIIKEQRLKNNGHPKMVKIYLKHTAGLSRQVQEIKRKISSIDEKFIVVSRKKN